MPNAPHRKDGPIIAAALAVAAALFIASRFLPKTDLADRIADATLPPDAVEYLSPTPTDAPSPEPALEPTARPTDEPALEPTAQPTPAPTGESSPMPTDAPTPAPTDAPSGEPALVGPMPAPQTDAVRGYVVLTVSGQQYGDPIPMDRDKIITVKQDGGRINRVHITPEKVFMESSTCENQDCVDEGEVTLENYGTRILGAWIICLPNGVTVELVPADEAP